MRRASTAVLLATLLIAAHLLIAAMAQSVR
jgi:hypothetical protein